MEKISQICQSSALAALAALSALSALSALVDRIGFPGPRGTAHYHTFVMCYSTDLLCCLPQSFGCNRLNQRWSSFWILTLKYRATFTLSCRAHIKQYTMQLCIHGELLCVGAASNRLLHGCRTALVIPAFECESLNAMPDCQEQMVQALDAEVRRLKYAFY